jgi:hypothetical protein
MMNLTFEIYLFILWSNSLHAVIFHGMGRIFHFPSEERRAADFYRSKKLIASAGFEPRKTAELDRKKGYYLRYRTETACLWNHLASPTVMQMSSNAHRNLR